MKTPPRASVVIASHRPDLLDGLLGALQEQSMPAESFEVIIVTDYPSGSLQQQYPTYSWLYVADISISRKRNCGVRIANGTVTAFIDDDCCPAPDWLATGCAYLENHPDMAAVEGLTTIESDHTYSSAATREYRRLEKQGYRTNNLFIRTEQFRVIGGFDERFTVQREDIDLAFTAFDHGLHFAFSNTIRVTHRFRHWEKWDLLKNCWNRRFDPLLFSKHPGRYFKMFRSPLPPSLALVLLIHLLLLSTLGKKRFPAVLGSIDISLVTLLGMRRIGLRPFNPEKLALETLQIIAAPLVVITALVYGRLVIARQPGK